MTVWGAFQLAGVKVSDAADTVASPVSPLVTSRTTFVTGCVPSATVKSSVEADSSTSVAPALSTTKISGVSF